MSYGTHYILKKFLKNVFIVILASKITSYCGIGLFNNFLNRKFTLIPAPFLYIFEYICEETNVSIDIGVITISPT